MEISKQAENWAITLQRLLAFPVIFTHDKRGLSVGTKNSDEKNPFMSYLNLVLKKEENNFKAEVKI